MALYAYEAFSKGGKQVQGVLDASSLTSAKEQLSRQGLFPISIVAATQEARYGFFKRLFMRGVSVKDKIIFSKQLAILLKSGVPLLQAFELLIDQFKGRFQAILISIKDELKEGTSLADALIKYPKVFDTIYVQLVRAGEASGQLEAILERLNEYLERREVVKKKLKDAMFMPMVQLVLAVIITTGLLVKVVPQMAEVFSGMGQELPGITKAMVNIADFIKSHYIGLILSIITSMSLFFYWRSTPTGARKIDEIKLKIPLVSYVTKTNAVVQFSYTLGMLLEGGVNLSQALDIVVGVIDNRTLADTLNEARDKIVKQGNISQYLKQTNIFPPIATHLINTGEQTGELDKMLLLVAKNYETELAEAIDKLTSALSLGMLVVVGIVILCIILAIALPMFSMGDMKL
ncbi:MAG: type II secretion system F family protein [Candidatus Dependentiae bacterium]|nr:type II secretion system F family protein [Candidatus Dependentiae bacterium]